MRSRIWLLTIPVLWLAPPAHALDIWTMPYYSQGLIKYLSDDKDTGYQGSASATVDLLGMELRWMQEAGKAKVLHPELSIKGEIIRQEILSSEYFLPRLQVRYGYGVDILKTGFRIMPVVQGQAGSYELLHVTDADIADHQRVLRKAVAGGAKVGWHFSHSTVFGKSHKENDSFELWALALYRYDLGAEASTVLPNPILANTAYEGTAGLTLWLAPMAILEARARYIQEIYKWNAAKASKGVSSLTNTLTLIDVVIGFHF